MVARAAGEPSVKRAKVDEADEEEDPLVRRKEELVVAAKEARSREDARAERVARRELALCTDFEAKNEKLLRRLPPELWQKILDENLHQNDLFALAMTCRFFREKQKDLGWKVETNLNPYRLLRLQKSGKTSSHTLGLFQWVCDTLNVMPGFKWGSKRVKGAVYEADLLNYAAFQGSVEILRWLVEEKGWELSVATGRWAGWGGSVAVLKYLEESQLLRRYGVDGQSSVTTGGYEFDEEDCQWAAFGGHLEALKFLRGLDPPCPWDEETCTKAAKGGHLEVLKWARAQEPPCPWDKMTCSEAAERGHLEVLKWLLDQDPPCPWDKMTCSEAAYGGHLEVLKWLRDQDPPCPWEKTQCKDLASDNGHQHIVEWIDRQKEDESDDEEYSDGD